VAKFVRLTFVDSGVTAVARLYEKDAPAVVEAMWTALEVPLEGKVTHAMASGEELMINMPDENRRFDPAKVPTQMATIHPRPGELLWTYLPPFYMEDFPTGLWDFIIVYGQCVLTSRETGPLICSRWARIEEGLAEFAAESASTYTEGQKVLRVERFEA
jgi:hypothetical protein